MKTLTLGLLLSGILLADLRYEWYHNFRTMDFQPAVQLVGPHAKEYVKSGPNGLILNLPSGSEKQPHTGIFVRPALEGDFEITAALEAIKVDKPDKGYGSGVSLYVLTDSPDRSAASLARHVTVTGRVVYATNYTREVNGKKEQRINYFPAGGQSFRLRLTRTGTVLHFSFVEGDDPQFQELDEVDLGSEGVNWVQVSANAGGGSTPLQFRLEDLRIRAQTLPAGNTLLLASWKVWLTACILTIAVCALSTGLWWGLRHRRARAGPHPRGL